MMRGALKQGVRASVSRRDEGETRLFFQVVLSSVRQGPQQEL